MNKKPKPLEIPILNTYAGVERLEAGEQVERLGVVGPGEDDGDALLAGQRDGVLAWRGIGRGLKPLTRLSAEIDRRAVPGQPPSSADLRSSGRGAGARTGVQCPDPGETGSLHSCSFLARRR